MDTLYINGKIHLMNRENRLVEAIGISGNAISFVGTGTEAMKKKSKETKIIDLKGGCVIPGFIDTHMHLLAYGQSLSQLNLSACCSQKEVVEISREFLEKYPKEQGQWLIGKGWNQRNFANGRELTKQDLDQISTTVPIIFYRACLHTAVCNSRGLEMARINARTEIDDGVVEVKNGQTTGILREYAITQVNRRIPEPTYQEKKQAVLLALSKLSQYGITTVHTDDLAKDNGGMEMLDIYKELENEGKLRVRLRIQCRVESVEEARDFIKERLDLRYNTTWIKISGLKLLGDGSLGGKTAALKEPYQGEVTRGMTLFSQEELNEIYLVAHSNHIPVLIHAIGDRTVAMAQEAIRMAKKQYPQIRDVRHGIIHCQIMGKEEQLGFKELKIVAYVQPVFILADHKIVQEYVGERREHTSYSWKTMLDQGTIVVFSSDSPVEDPNPYVNIYCAIERKDLNGNPEEGWLPQERFTLLEALKAYTSDGAYASYDEQTIGQLVVGRKADFLVFANNLFEESVDNLISMKPVMSVVDGKTIDWLSE